MKKSSGIITLALSVISSIAVGMALLLPSISFEKTEHDFGKIPRHEPVICEFVFTNNGDAPLIIQEVKPSCGCTTPEWPKKPINPGKTGVIKAEYNAASEGDFSKTIKVTTNAQPAEMTLKIKGTVVPSNIGGGSEQKGTELKLEKK